MRSAFALLSNAPVVESLPSAAARQSLLTSIARHEDRLETLRGQADESLRRGAVEADEALEAAVGALDSSLTAATRTLTSELDELAASCEDGLASATHDAALRKERGTCVARTITLSAHEQTDGQKGAHKDTKRSR